MDKIPNIQEIKEHCTNTDCMKCEFNINNKFSCFNGSVTEWDIEVMIKVFNENKDQTDTIK